MNLSLNTNVIKSFGKTSENNIRDLEKILNIKFPNDYKDFLLKMNGGSVSNVDANKIVLKKFVMEVMMVCIITMIHIILMSLTTKIMYISYLQISQDFLI